MGLREWVSVIGPDTEREGCPECGSLLENAYVRSPNFQNHWRGVKALQCPDCGYAKEDTGDGGPGASPRFVCLDCDHTMNTGAVAKRHARTNGHRVEAAEEPNDPTERVI